MKNETKKERDLNNFNITRMSQKLLKSKKLTYEVNFIPETVYKIQSSICYIPEDSKQTAICHNDRVSHCMEKNIT